MTGSKGDSSRKSKAERGPFGDARPDAGENDMRTGGSNPQEDVEDRDNVSTVKPEEYPEADRLLSKP